MKRVTLVTTAVLLAVILLGTSARGGDYGTPKRRSDVNMFALAQDLQKGRLDERQQTLLIWMPLEYFEVTLAADKTIPASMRMEMLDTVASYMVVAASQIPSRTADSRSIWASRPTPGGCRWIRWWRIDCRREPQ